MRSGPPSHWPGHSDLWGRSGPDLGPRGPGLGNITGFETRDGLRVGVRGVWVGVAKLIPSPNPYPQDGLTGFGGFFHGFSQYGCLPNLNKTCF